MLQELLSNYFKKQKVSNHMYDILATTPILHSSEELERLYGLACSDYQKACIMQHIINFEGITMKYSDYRKIYNRIYDSCI